MIKAHNHYFPFVWLNLLETLVKQGHHVTVRDQATLELSHHTLVVDMRYPVLTVPERRLNYRFMAAEAAWILSGDDRVATITPYNERIADYSDDGLTFFGAYGPRIEEQLDYVVRKLIADPSSRQAGLTTWRPNPPVTKDVPCTVALFFSIRDGWLHCHAFMRSSDAWLGVPYDVFNFSMLTYLICGLLNAHYGQPKLVPGRLYLTAASSHLYHRDVAKVADLLTQSYGDEKVRFDQVAAYPHLYSGDDTGLLMRTLKAVCESAPGDECRWWELRDE